MSSAPLSVHLQSRGARLSEAHGATMISSFGDLTAEHHALKTGVAALDLSPFPRYHLTGRDRVRYLHGMITHDVEHLEPGQGNYATVITSNGRTLSDLWVFADTEHLRLVFPPISAEATLKHLDFYLIADKAEFEETTAEAAFISLQGPGAASLLSSLGLKAPEGAHAWVSQPFRGDITLSVYAVDRCGQGGFDIEAPPEAAPALWDALLAAGAVPAGMEALNISRVEAGLPWAGHELVEKVIPMELPITESAISFKKGCYIGQEVLAKIKYRGKVNRRLVRFQAPEPINEGDRIFFDGRDLGWVTSLVTSPTEGRIALGILHRKAIEGDAAILAGGDGADTPGVEITPSVIGGEA